MTSLSTDWRAEPAKTRREEEAQLQRTIVAHLTQTARRNCWWYMINNGGKKSKAAAGRDKAMGLRAGTADLGFVLPSGKAAFLELKASTGALSPAQKVFRDWCEASAVPYVVTSDIDYALGVLRAWGVLPEVRR